jgi:hypothetical protein
MQTSKPIFVRIVVGDALSYKTDVLALKYAQNFYGVDLAAYKRLPIQRPKPLPKPGKFVLYDSFSSLGATKVMFLGVQPLVSFGYPEIREFARKVVSLLAVEDPKLSDLALTIHGSGYGLDEIEAFESELAGVIEAISAGDFPRALRAVTFVERDPRRGERLTAALRRLLPAGKLEVDGPGILSTLEDAAQTTLRSAGYASVTKPRAFVAMPFAPEMDDIFHYGIQRASKAAGLLCERADLSTFTGDVMEWVKKRISSAKLVLADLSTANPNVYLEVGYAWGCNVPTVLLAKDTSDLKFDVKTQRCIVYKSIKHLEQSLARELKELVNAPSRRTPT